MTEDHFPFDLLVIGAGPAGLFAAITAAAKGLRVGLLEKKGSPGLKLLIAGTGQCNVTHAGAVGNFLRHYGAQSRFVRPCLYAFDNRALATFFAERGLAFIEMNGGKLFPETLRSRDVLSVLVDECRKLKVTLQLNTEVTEIKRAADRFEVMTTNGSFSSKRLILTTGGRSYPTTGSTGDGYQLAQGLGHTITEIAPALTPVYVNEFPYAACAGISMDQIRIQLFRAGRKINQFQGDLLFTHKGVSGPVIIDSSRYFEAGDLLKLALTDFKNVEEFEKALLTEIAANGKRQLKNLLARYEIPERLVVILLEHLGIDPELKAADLEKKSRKQLVEYLMELPIQVDRLGGFKEAMATRGGVALSEVNPKTMESRLVAGLYFAGEVLDVDGDTGGYNIQFACSSGVMAGRHVSG